MSDTADGRWRQSAAAAEILKKENNPDSLSAIARRGYIYRQIVLLRHDCMKSNRSFVEAVAKLLADPPKDYTAEDIQEALDFLTLNDSIPNKFDRDSLN